MAVTVLCHGGFQGSMNKKHWVAFSSGVMSVLVLNPYQHFALYNTSKNNIFITWTTHKWHWAMSVDLIQCQ